MKARGRLLWVLPPEREARASLALPRVAGALVAALSARDASWLPPVVRLSPEGVLVDSPLRCPRELAARIGAALSSRRFAPFIAWLEVMEAWCERASIAHAGRIADGIFTVTNGDLFGSAIAEAFVIVAASGRAARATLETRGSGLRRALDLFLRRFGADAERGIFRAAGYTGRLVRISSRGDESHNGGQSVLEIVFEKGAIGTKLAYKPRPSGGEWIFAREHDARGPRSVFEILNSLPPTSGRISLPTMRVLRGVRADRRAYGWHEWIERPRGWGVLRRAKDLRVEGCRLRARDAEAFWHHAGALSAACFAFGIEDLIADNVVVGQRRGRRSPAMFPIDLEVFGTPMTSLVETGLVTDGARRRKCPNVGLERTPPWSSVDAPLACFFATEDGALELRATHLPRARKETRSVVSDAGGRTGYGHYIAAFLRGMFDVWTLLTVHRRRVVSCVGRLSSEEHTRVLVRPTTTYWAALRRHLLGGRRSRREDVLVDAERAQLARLDVPYFARRCSGGPLLAVRPPPDRGGVEVSCDVPDGIVVPSPEVLGGSMISWESLGAAIRDAVAYVSADLGPGVIVSRRWGVVLDGRAASFDWREAGQRLRFSWTQRTVRMNPTSLAGPAPRRDHETRRQLLAIDRLDASLRERLVESGGADDVAKEDLDTLGRAAVPWLADVVRARGWPGVRLVGKRASDAASRILQHGDVPSAFGRRCLELMHHAAAADDLSLREVAYVTDALRLAAGHPQLFGTKFTKDGNDLVALPIEDGDRVDVRRRRMGLEPLDAYKRRLASVFGEETVVS